MSRRNNPDAMMQPDFAPPTRAQIEMAIETLNSAYTYDPPERWLPAYTLLRELQAHFKAVRRPFRWLGWVALAAMAASALLVFFLFIVVPSASASWLAAPFLLFILVPNACLALARHSAKQREPLLELEDRVRGARQKFDRKIAESQPEQRNVTT